MNTKNRSKIKTKHFVIKHLNVRLDDITYNIKVDCFIEYRKNFNEIEILSNTIRKIKLNNIRFESEEKLIVPDNQKLSETIAEVIFKQLSKKIK